MDGMERDGDAARVARTRTIKRLLWSAQAEGLTLQPSTENSSDCDSEFFEAVLMDLRIAVAASCASRGVSFDESNWAQLVAEAAALLNRPLDDLLGKTEQAVLRGEGDPRLLAR